MILIYENVSLFNIKADYENTKTQKPVEPRLIVALRVSVVRIKPPIYKLSR